MGSVAVLPVCLRMRVGTDMGRRELIDRELSRLSEPELEKLLAYLRSLSESREEALMPRIAAESALAKDWLSNEEDEAWAGL